jgi:hypothetical protein
MLQEIMQIFRVSNVLRSQAEAVLVAMTMRQPRFAFSSSKPQQKASKHQKIIHNSAEKGWKLMSLMDERVE